MVNFYVVFLLKTGKEKIEEQCLGEKLLSLTFADFCGHSTSCYSTSTKTRSPITESTWAGSFDGWCFTWETFRNLYKNKNLLNLWLIVFQMKHMGDKLISQHLATFNEEQMPLVEKQEKLWESAKVNLFFAQICQFHSSLFEKIKFKVMVLHLLRLAKMKR